MEIPNTPKMFTKDDGGHSLIGWAKRLKRWNAEHGTADGTEKDHQQLLAEETAKALQSLTDSKRKLDASYRLIPTFIDKKKGVAAAAGSEPPQESEMQLAVAEIARELFLDTHEERLLSEHDLDCLFNNMVTLLKQYPASNSTPNNNCFLSYDIFRELKHSLPPRAHKFFTASVFRKFPMNRHGQIRGISLHQFVSMSLNLLHQFITLCRYDISWNMVTGPHFMRGHLTENDLELFIGDQIEMIPELAKIDEAFHPYFIYHAVRKFMFCLNPENGRKSIPITKLLCSEAFREFNEFRFSSQQKAQNSDDSAKMMKNNWFSCSNALRIYKMYLELDCDHNGTLSQKEMLQFNQSSLSNLCVERIFQYKKTWDQEMDYKGFLNFVLAIEHKHLLSSLHYFWDILDLDGSGYLTPLTLHTLFRSVQKKMGIFGLEPTKSEDVLNEITDMVHPKDPDKITKLDLIHSKVWGTVIDILTDVKGFWEYDNREAIAAPPP